MATAMMAAFGLRRCRALSRLVSLATRSNNNNDLISFSAPSRPPFANTIPSLKREISTTNACRRYDESKEETRQILFEGCDYEHWLVTMEFPEPQPSREEKIDTFIKTLAKVVGSEEEAKKRLYALSTTTYTGFQAQISEETSEKLKGLPGVVWVLPDSYIDPVNKEYGGDKYMNGIIVPDTRVYNNTITRNNQRRPPRNVAPPSPPNQPRNPGLPPPPGQTMNAGLPPPPVQQSHVGPPSPGGHPGYGRPPTPLGGEQNYSRPWSPGQQLPHNMSTPSHSPPADQPQAGYGMPPPPGNQHGYNMPPPSGNQQSYNAPVSSPGNQQGYGQQGQYQQNYSRGPSYDYPPQVYQGQPAATPGYQQGYNTPMQGNNFVPSYQQDYNRAPPQMDNRGQHPDYQQDFRRPPPSQMDQTRPGSYQQNNNWSVPPLGNSTGVVPGNYNRPSPPQPPISGDYRSSSASPPTNGASHFSNHTQEGQRDPWPMEGAQ